MKHFSKKLPVLFLALLCVFTFAACGSDAETDDAAKTPALSMEISQADWDSYRQFVDLSTGITMAYVEMGVEDGDPLVLIHGMTDNSRSWSLIAPYFAEAGYHIYMIDLRGHGESDQPDTGFYTTANYAADISAFMDAMEIAKADIIGHSLGSMTAQTFELLYPEKCDHVVWESTTPVSADALGTYYYEYGESIGAEGHPDDAFMEEWYYCNNPVDEEFLTYEMEESQALPGADWERIAGGASFSNLLPYYQYMDDSIPTLILWGSADGFFGEDNQDQLKELVPFAEFVAYDGIGHNIQWEHTAQMAKDCIAFFQDEEIGGN
ncbi:MAG TPA: alpha/beta hydrolase [Clostridiales bacterium]|nr:alpha/beta hydrolase [Clostridiales bacterium]